MAFFCHFKIKISVELWTVEKRSRIMAFNWCWKFCAYGSLLHIWILNCSTFNVQPDVQTQEVFGASSQDNWTRLFQQSSLLSWYTMSVTVLAPYWATDQQINDCWYGMLKFNSPSQTWRHVAWSAPWIRSFRVTPADIQGIWSSKKWHLWFLLQKNMQYWFAQIWVNLIMYNDKNNDEKIACINCSGHKNNWSSQLHTVWYEKIHIC